MTTQPSATQSPTKNQPKAKPAADVRYDGDIAARVCERIATTPQSMVEICEAPDMPGIATLFRWLHKHPEFREMYVIAKQEQVEILMDECHQIVNDTSRDVIVTDDGRTILNPVAVQRARLQFNYYKWIASKLLPRKYGNNAQLAAAAPPPPPPAEEDSGGGYVLTVERMLEMQALHQQDLKRMEREDREEREREEKAKVTHPPSTPPRG